MDVYAGALGEEIFRFFSITSNCTGEFLGKNQNNLSRFRIKHVAHPKRPQLATLASTPYTEFAASFESAPSFPSK
jgi:hypothetical protein